MERISKISLILLIVCALFLCSCDSASVYDQANEYSKKQEEALKDMANNAGDIAQDGIENAEDMIDRAVASSSRYISKGLNRFGWIVIFCSLVIGIAMALICSHTAAIKLFKTSITVFILGIPILMLLLMYGMAFLSSWFM